MFGPIAATRCAFACAAIATLIPAGWAGWIATAVAQDARPNRLVIEYVPPKEAKHQPIYNMLKERKALETFQQIFSPFRYPVDLPVKTMSCGMSNAWYQRAALTICYEYLEDIQNMIPKETTAAGLTPADVMMGQFFYVVAHEMGHATFDLMNVPLFGRAEDAADGFATYMMLRIGKHEARRLIGGAAYGYKEYLKNPKVVVATAAFSDAHGTPIQRFYNLLCLAYGSDRALYADLVEDGRLPKERARSCGMEYGELNYAFQQLIRPQLDPVLAKTVLDKPWLPAAELSPRTSGQAPK